MWDGQKLQFFTGCLHTLHILVGNQRSENIDLLKGAGLDRNRC